MATASGPPVSGSGNWVESLETLQATSLQIILGVNRLDQESAQLPNPLVVTRNPEIDKGGGGQRR